ncbi:Uncharacterised protein [Vibrio paracholerae]|nr:Uncharacterised protein [Vibrio paracholerae]
MTKLRNTTKASIYNRLDSTYFTANSFKVEYHESDSTFVNICFLPQPEFKFQISTSKGYNAKGWVVSEAPGEHLREVERVSVSDFDQVINRIPHWAQRILEDYCSGQLKLATFLAFTQYRRSDSLGVRPPLYQCGLSWL